MNYFDSLNASTLATFGEPCIVRVDAIDTPLTGIVSRATGRDSMMGMEFRDIQPSALFDAATFAVTGAGPEDVVLIPGTPGGGPNTEHVIVSPPEPDDGGMTKVVLRKKP